MKKILYLILLLPLTSRAQDSLLNTLPLRNGLVYYSDVVKVDGVDRQELHKRAKRWVVDAYKSAKDVIQLDDPESGELVIKGHFRTFWQMNFMGGQEANVDHTIKISVKDGKYKYEIEGLVVSGYTSSSRYVSGGPWEYPIEKLGKDRPANTKKYFTKSVAPEIEATIISLKKAMNTPISTSQEW